MTEKINLYIENLTNDIEKKRIQQTVSYIKKTYKGTDILDKIKRGADIAEIVVSEAGGGINTYISALIYGSLKNEMIEKDTLIGLKSDAVNNIIDGLLKIPCLNFEKIKKQSNNLINFLLTVTGDVRAVLIMLAVQIYKMREISKLPDDEQKKIVLQTTQLFAPLAHRIGLYKIKTELEETAMKYEHRKMYHFIANKLIETKAERDDYIVNFIEPIKKDLEKAGFDIDIKGRPKSIFSIWKKMQKQKVKFEEVYDLFAIRIIIKSIKVNFDKEDNSEKKRNKKIKEKEKELCWQVYSIVTNSYRPNTKRLRDWISFPKQSAYESLHTTVMGINNKWVEIQIRTKRMDEIAEKGPAAHWKYKNTKKTDNSEWLLKIREAIENPIFVNQNNDDETKSAMYSNEIFVFTPKGDLKGLKDGYTVLDFAFSIHTKIGNTCSGAVINGSIKPLTYEPKNGDLVKILTSKNKQPNDSWLKIVKSKRARSKIKRALKEKVFRYSKNGKEIIKQKLAQLRKEFTEDNIRKLVKYFNTKTALELYQQFGENKIDSLKISKAFVDETEKQEHELKEIKEFFTEQKITTANDVLIIDNNLSSINYEFAKCCNPIPGDYIFGFVTVSKGTKIHRRSCPNASDMMRRYPYRVLKVMWNSESKNTNFICNIIVAGSDKIGITASISNVINNEFKLKIKAINLNTRKKDKFDGTVVVVVKNRKQLIKLIDRLKKIKGIENVREK